jgi:dihydrofolate reductase
MKNSGITWNDETLAKYLADPHADIPGDTYFPAFDPAQWDDVEFRTLPADERHAYPLTFVTLERRNAPAAPRPH